MTVSDKGGAMVYRILSDSIFNIYNVVTVIAALRELGLSHEEIKAGLNKAKIVETRFNVQKAGNVTVIMQMSKDKTPWRAPEPLIISAACPALKNLFL